MSRKRQRDDDEGSDEELDIADAPDPTNATTEDYLRYNHRSVERAVSILNVLQESVDGMSLAQMGKTLGMAKASLFRYLWTLERLRYVERDRRTGRYSLGLGFLSMQSRLSEVLRERARPRLERLREETGETANLGMLDGDEVIYLAIVESFHGVRMARSHGSRDPLHCTALGKAIAGQLPDDQVRNILDRAGMPSHTPNTMTTVDAYLQELATVRHQGFAVDDGEHDRHGRCVAVPILGTNLPAALSVSAPASRFTLADAEGVAKMLIDVAEKIAVASGADRRKQEPPG